MNAIALAVLTGLAGCATGALGFRLHALDARLSRVRARVHDVARTHGRASSAPRTAGLAAASGRGDRPVLGGRLTRALGVHPDRPELYPLPWWSILLGAGFPALLVPALIAHVTAPTAWLLAPPLWLVLARATFRFFHSRRERLLYRQMPDALSMIVRSVRAGIPVSEALRVVGREAMAPTAQEFARLYDQMTIGRSLEEAVREMARRTGLQEYGFFAVALALQGQTGGSLTDALENLADVIRKRVALKARAIALSSEARSTAMVLIAMPFVTTAMLAVVSPSYIVVLFDTSRSQQLLLAGIGSLVMGIVSMQAIIRRSLS